MATKLFVGGLSWDTTDETLRAFFAPAGTVVSANVITDKFTGKSRGFGFVEMSTEEEAKKAVTELNGKPLDERAVVVNEARPQAPREDSMGGGSSFNRDRRPRGNFQRGGGSRRSY